MALSECPSRCMECGAAKLSWQTVSYTTTIKYEGCGYAVTVPDLLVERCDCCGDFFLNPAARERLYDALRGMLGLLRPSEIRMNREKLGKTQAEMARLLRISPEIISRWETGAVVQSRGNDVQMRLYFFVPAAREYLERGRTPPQHFVLTTSVFAPARKVDTAVAPPKSKNQVASPAVPQFEVNGGGGYALVA